jgi:Protein of unknown function (DUF2877)
MSSARTSIPVSAPPRIWDLIRSSPDGPVPIVHRGPHAVYVALDGPDGTRCVGLLGRDATQVPCGLRSRIPRFAAWASAACVAGGTLHVDRIPLTVGRAVDVRVPTLHHGALPRQSASPVTPAATPQAVVAGLVSRLLGRGPGLTPLGDDIICGWIATHRSAGVPTPEIDAAVRAGLPRTTLLSATLLDCALHGEVLPELGRFLAAVGTHTEACRAADLRAVGATSGAGLLHGARLALEELGQRAQAGAA